MPQPATIALPDSEGFVLEGLYEPADSARGVVIAPPHPLYGGSMESPVVGQLAFAAQEAGLASLAFNWRGVGASGGSPSGDFGDATADYAAAASFLEDTVEGPLAAAGYSFGAATAARIALANDRVDALMLIAPPVSMMDLDALAAFEGRVWILAGERDDLAPAAPLVEFAAENEYEVHIAEGADHFFMASLSEILTKASHFMKRLG